FARGEAGPLKISSSHAKSKPSPARCCRKSATVFKVGIRTNRTGSVMCWKTGEPRVEYPAKSDSPSVPGQTLTFPATLFYLIPGRGEMSHRNCDEYRRWSTIDGLGRQNGFQNALRQGHEKIKECPTDRSTDPGH